ncbi:ParB/RepB/Spo0J family partition protein [Flavobacteriales bacterium]|nr:ParB/RepB/Spo0J family partition protein [Flavobacteriales bacterium]
MAPSKGLGRGLDALLGHPSDARPATQAVSARTAAGVPKPSSAVRQVPIADIEANPNQPRQEFDEAGLKALAESIDALGIIQPITLRRVRASKFQIISGERRFRAAQMVGLDALPAYVREADDQTLLEMALVENIQREDLNPLEVALSYKRLMDDCGLTQQELGKRVGKARSSVTNHLRTLDLPMRIQHMLREGLLGLGHAKALAGLSGNDALYQQVALAEKALAEGASVRELESWVKALKSPGTASAKSQRERLAVREDETLALDRLRMKLSDTHAKLAIQRSPKGGGQITLKYQDLTDLESILNKLGLH